jgi:hypothetical protein
MSDTRPSTSAFIQGELAMDRPQSRLAKSAAVLVLFPILGLLGGILLGVIRAWIWRGDEFMNLWLTVRSAFLGSVFGAAAAVILAVLERKNLTSLRRQMAFILAVAVAVVIWAIVVLIRDLLASGVL